MGILRLSKRERDILTEIANIGTGKATLALEKLSGCNVKHQIPKVSLRNGLKFKDVLACEVDLRGGINGKAVLSFPSEDVSRLVKLIAWNCRVEPELAGFKEISNVFVGNFLSAISSFLEIKLSHTVPRTLGQREVAKIIGKQGIAFDAPVTINEQQIRGHFMLVLDEKNSDLLFKHIQKKF